MDSDQNSIRTDDNRRMPRYAVGTDFPFNTKLTLFQNEGAQNVPTGKDWSVSPVNLSETGASVQLNKAAVASQGETCVFKFIRGTYVLNIPSAIAHFRCYSQYSLCGISFNFPNSKLQREYLQLLGPVIIGSSLVRVGAVQDTPSRHKEQFHGNEYSALSVSREAPGGQITSFDLRMQRYVVRWPEGAPELEVYGISEATNPREAVEPASLISLNETQLEEVRALFNLAVPNISKSVPEDVRQFLGAMVT